MYPTLPNIYAILIKTVFMLKKAEDNLWKKLQGSTSHQRNIATLRLNLTRDRFSEREKIETNMHFEWVIRLTHFLVIIILLCTLILQTLKCMLCLTLIHYSFLSFFIFSLTSISRNCPTIRLLSASVDRFSVSHIPDFWVQSGWTSLLCIVW